MQILVKKIRNAFNSLMYPRFMNCHGLAKVNDKESRSIKRGNSLFQKVLGVIDYSVLLFQCQHQTSEPWFSLGIILLGIRSSLPASVQHEAELWHSGLHSPQWFFSPLVGWQGWRGTSHKEAGRPVPMQIPSGLQITDDSFLGRVVAHQRGPWERKQRGNLGGGRGGASS